MAVKQKRSRCREPGRSRHPKRVTPRDRDLPSAGDHAGSVLVTGNTVLGGSLDEFAEIVARSINRRGQFA